MENKIKRFLKGFMALTTVFGLAFTNIQPVFAEGDESDGDGWDDIVIISTYEPSDLSNNAATQGEDTQNTESEKDDWSDIQIVLITPDTNNNEGAKQQDGSDDDDGFMSDPVIMRRVSEDTSAQEAELARQQAEEAAKQEDDWSDIQIVLITPDTNNNEAAKQAELARQKAEAARKAEEARKAEGAAKKAEALDKQTSSQKTTSDNTVVGTTSSGAPVTAAELETLKQKAMAGDKGAMYVYADIIRRQNASQKTTEQPKPTPAVEKAETKTETPSNYKPIMTLSDAIYHSNRPSNAKVDVFKASSTGNVIDDSLAKEVEKQVYEALNAQRKAAGLSSLEKRELGADTWATIMCETGLYEHANLSGEYGIKYNWGGENIARLGKYTTAEQIVSGTVNGWNNSSGHYKNRMKDVYDYYDFSIVKGDDGYYYAVERFASNKTYSQYLAMHPEQRK